MNFSVASVSVDWTAAAVSLVLLVLYVLAAVMAGRRFGIPGLWAAWIAGIVAATLFPLAMHDGPIAHFHVLPMLFHTAVLAVPLGISAWVIARTLRRPRPVGVPTQVALGTLAFIPALLLTAAVVFIVMATH